MIIKDNLSREIILKKEGAVKRLLDTVLGINVHGGYVYLFLLSLY